MLIMVSNESARKINMHLTNCIFRSLVCFLAAFFIYLAPVVQRVDNAIQRINHYPVDSVVCFANTYLLDSDLSGG